MKKTIDFFLEDSMKIWNVCVIESEDTKQIDGVLVSVKHPGSTMLGPGFMRSEEDALALIRYQLDQASPRRSACMVGAVIVPFSCVGTLWMGCKKL